MKTLVLAIEQLANAVAHGGVFDIPFLDTGSCYVAFGPITPLLAKRTHDAVSGWARCLVAGG